MKLELQQIKSAANGIVRTEENELGLELHRFTRDQEAFFYKTHPLYCKESFFNGYFAKNCRTCAGITLDFISDAKSIKFQFGKIENQFDKPAQTFDVYVDGEYLSSYDLETEIIQNEHGGKKQFTVYFPYFVFPIVSSIELEDAIVFEPIKNNIDILFLGDSITHGLSAKHPSNSYVMRVARKLGVGILNQGNSGFVYDAGSIEKVCEPKIIVTAYGINDFMRKDITLIEGETTEYLKKLKEVYKNSKIVSILPLWTKWDGEDKNFKAQEKAVLRKVYQEYSDYIIDGHKLIPHDEKFLSDDVHPNDDGFGFYGENLAKELEKIINKKGLSH